MKKGIHPSEEPFRALPYCRVSSPGQKKDGHGLDSQEHRCRQWAELSGIEVERVFEDDFTGEGDFMRREGMVELLDYLSANKRKPASTRKRYVVVFDDLKRFSRDPEFYFKLKTAITQRGATLKCLNFHFEDSPEGEFNETIFVAHGKLEIKQNRRQVIQKMRAHVDKGRYVFAPAVGYKWVEMEDKSKKLVRDEPNATIIAEALEAFAAGRIQSGAEFKRHLEQFPTIPHNARGQVGLQTAFNILRRPLYAGHFSIKPWDIHLRKGIHEPLISLETWKRIQDRLAGNAPAPYRRDLSKDFPLRGTVACTCGYPMTAGWSKGRKAHYPYYFCQNKACDSYKKSIRKEKIEGDFEALLKELQPAPELFAAARAMLTKIWDGYRQQAKEREAAGKAEIAALERKTAQLMDRVVKADSASLVAAYEKEIVKLEESKALLAEKWRGARKPLASFDETYRTACAFLASPWKLWDSGALEYRKTLLRLLFPGRVQYCRNTGYRTAGVALPFRLLSGFAAPKYKMVEGGGFEPPYAEAGRFTVCWI